MYLVPYELALVNPPVTMLFLFLCMYIMHLKFRNRKHSLAFFLIFTFSEANGFEGIVYETLELNG